MYKLDMKTPHSTRSRPLAFPLVCVLFLMAGCASAPEKPQEEVDMAARYIATMDAKPPEERVPDWDETKRLMLRKAPAVGDEAPDFELPREDGSGHARLSALWSEKPVVLVFGSYT